jgi:hypothetical protein
MAVTAIDTVVPDVVLVTKLYGLLFLQVSARQIRRSGDLRINIKRRPRKNDA